MSRTEPLELVYFRGCPSVEAARAAIRGALGALGLPLSWREWDLDNPYLPVHLQAFPSPTVLVRGRDVLGDGPIAMARACRAGSVPTPELIVAALERTRG
jgi:acetyl esterase/lipase